VGTDYLWRERKGEGGSDRVMATRARGQGKGRESPRRTRKARTWRDEGEGRYQGRVILAPRHVTPVVDRLLGLSTKSDHG